MKKCLSFLIIAALFAACQPNNELGTPFQAGQEVTLCAHMPNAGSSGAHQLPGKQRISGKDAGTQIDLTWDAGDEIKVIVGDKSATFTLASGAGSGQATFTGTMPADGVTYSVQYPIADPDLSLQTYVEDGFGKGLMKMVADNGTIDDGFVLKAQHALLGLQLSGSDALGKIVLTNPSDSKTYTLDCSDVTLTDEATLFYIVVPAGKWADGFTVDIYADDNTTIIKTLTKNSSATFSATEAMVMPEQEVATPTNKENGYEYVDLGLSVKWATCNVGATKPEESGDYFAWGETQPKSTTYNWSTYKWCNASSNPQTKYCTNSYYGTVDNKTQLELSDDAARANWGGSWRMPTDAELTELRENCTWTWTTQNGVNGYKVTSKKNGNSIFLPAAGYRGGSSLYNAGSNGYYWSSSLYTDNPLYAWNVYFGSDNVRRYKFTRYYGFSVRPVCQQNLLLMPKRGKKQVNMQGIHSTDFAKWALAESTPKRQSVFGGPEASYPARSAKSAAGCKT